MANTRDVMGEQACLDALVANTLTSFEDDSITKVGNYCLRNKTALTDITLSQCKSIGSSGLYGCSNLEVVDMLGTGTISGNAFDDNAKLAHLLLRGTDKKTTLDSTSAFDGTPINVGLGAIYVDETLLSAYKSDTRWGNYFITTLDKYPLTDLSTITEGWAELDAMTQEQIAAKYAVGDTKLVDLGTEGKVYMQIVGFGLDDLTSGGKAKVTFIAKIFTKSSHRMNPTNSNGTQGTGANGGWEHCEVRTYLSDTIFPLLPPELQTAIKSVTKYSDYIVPGETSITHDQETQDKLWIPSAREVLGGTSYEQTGPIYTSMTSSTSSRIGRNQSFSNTSWWLRSAYSNSAFRHVTNTGSIGNSASATSTNGIILGFCI